MSILILMISFISSSTFVFAQGVGKTHIENFMEKYNKNPKSFQEFLTDLRESEFAGNEVMDSAIFPVSRSLQKGKVSYKFPRQIVSLSNEKLDVNFNQSIVDGPQIFIGYAPEAESLEVINWNSSKKKYDFFLIENFGPEKKPKLAKPDEKTCLKCHQSGGPIFTPFPWSESSIGGNTRAEIVHNQKTSKATEKMTDAELKLKKFSSISTMTTRGIFQFDANVRIANDKIIFERMCNDLKKNANKDKILEKVIIASHTETNNELANKLKSEIFSLLKSNYSHPSSVILDHDPTSEAFEDRGPVVILTDKEKFIKSLRKHLPDLEEPLSSISKNEAVSFSESISTSALFVNKEFIRGGISPEERIKIEGVKTIIQSKNAEGSLLNPITPRPDISGYQNSIKQLQKSIYSCLFDEKNFLIDLNSIPIEDLEHILRKAQLTNAKDPQTSLKMSVREFYENKPDCPPVEKVLTPEVQLLSEDAQQITLNLATSGLDLSKKIDETKAFKNIQKSCSGCHEPQSKDYFGIDIQYPQNEKDMEKFAKHNLKNSKDSPLMRLFDKSMPLDTQLEDQEREEMMIYILKFIKK